MRPIPAISAYPNTVEYNFFNQPVEITEAPYRLWLSYGADQQRSRTIYYKNDTLQYTRYHINKYYEREVDTAGIIHHYRYIYGENGVVALHIEKVKSSGGGGYPYDGPTPSGIIGTYYIHTDHLGSYCALTDAGKQVKQRNYFDPWGNFIPILLNRDGFTLGLPPDDDDPQAAPTLNFTLTNRGFTGHEHYPYFKIINMNGRLYDPVVARFFSPDKYVANSSFTQDFNRYTYCRNNPLMYTDPSGQKIKWWGWMLIGLGVDALTGGAISAGAMLTASIALPTAMATSPTAASFGIAVGSMAATTAISTYPLTALTTIPFLPYNGMSGDMNRVKNAFRINNGLFVTDKNKNFFGRLWQFVSRNSWEVLQTIGGYAYTQGRNLGGKVDQVEYWGGATFAITENVEDFKGWSGVSLSNYINVKLEGELNRDYPGGWIYGEDGLFLHEYGHTFDSRIFGLSYLFAVGIPSAVNRDGRYTWTELRANNHVFKYLKKYGLLDSWDEYEDDYPLKKK
jgi:RHS repeat-associated protein